MNNEDKIKALEQQLKLLNHIISVIPVHLYWKDKDGVYLGCNDAQAKTLGFKSGKEIIGLTDFDLPWPDKNAANIFRIIDEKVIKEQRVIQAEERVGKSGHEKAIYLSTKSPLYEPEQQEAMGVLGISIDVTEKKQREQYEQKHKEALRTIQLLQTLAGNLAHELRTPLASLKLGLSGINRYLETLVEGYILANEHGLMDKQPIRDTKLNSLSELPARLNLELDHCNAFINLTLRNINTESMSIENFSQYKIAYILKTAIESYPFTAEERAILHIDIQDNFDVIADLELLKHIIWNLIKNALYYIQEQRKGEIYIWTNKDSDSNYLYLKDTAKGIAPEMLNQIFERYFSKRLTGTGLGLAYCKLVMEQHSGSIDCESVEGEYMKLILKFPVVHPDA